MMEKMTYTKALEVVLNGGEMTNEVREKLEALQMSLEKRSSHKSDKPSKASREAAEFAQTVFQTLNEADAEQRCGDLAKILDVSGQKVSAALTKLMKAGLVGKRVEKGVSWFSVVGPDME